MARSRPVDSDLVILAGGHSRRFGGVDKVMALLAGRPILAHVLAAPVTGRRVVVGPVRAVTGVDAWVTEDPPGGGPVAGLAAGTALTTAPVVVVLAGDTPRAAKAVPSLIRALVATPAADVAVITAGGRRQHLLAAWRRPALLAALARLDTPAGAPAHALFAGAVVVEVADPAQWSRDVDTPQDLAAMTAPVTAWVAEAATALDLDPTVVDVDLVLDLARDAAHGVARPAAPLTTFLAGLAAGRAGGGPAAVQAAVATLTTLLGDRPPTPS